MEDIGGKWLILLFFLFKVLLNVMGFYMLQMCGSSAINKNSMKLYQIFFYSFLWRKKIKDGD